MKHTSSTTRREAELGVRPMKYLLGFFALLASAITAFAQLAETYTSELVRKAEAIAIIRVDAVTMQKGEGTVLFLGKEVPTSLLIYTTSTIETVKGKLPKTPIIVQYYDGETNPLEEGEYLVFLTSANGLYFPMHFGYKIEDGQVSWYSPLFERGGYGPFMKRMPIGRAISDIKTLLSAKKKAQRHSPDKNSAHGS